MEVLLVRHGESQNNVVALALKDQHVNKETHHFDLEAFEGEWMQQRSDDPPVSALGQRQAEAVGAALAPKVLQSHAAGLAKGNRGAVIFVSPFKRTLQTVAPLAKACAGIPVVVNPDIYEIGGVYTNGPDGKRTGPGESLDVAGMKELVGDAFNYDAVAAEGGWYTGGWETDAEARDRVRRLKAWLKALASPAKPSDHHSLVVLVMHGALIDNLTKAFMGLYDSPEDDVEGMQNHVHRPVRVRAENCSTTSFIVNARGQVSVQWVNRIGHLGSVPVAL